MIAGLVSDFSAVMNDSLQTFQKDSKLFNMTLVLGGRCRDGVVIVTDMKISSLASGSHVFLKYETKISGVFLNIIFGYAGDVIPLTVQLLS
jgi:20S proteasome alpha/beta subunit